MTDVLHQLAVIGKIQSFPLRLLYCTAVQSCLKHLRCLGQIQPAAVRCLFNEAFLVCLLDGVLDTHRCRCRSIFDRRLDALFNHLRLGKGSGSVVDNKIFHLLGQLCNPRLHRLLSGRTSGGEDKIGQVILLLPALQPGKLLLPRYHHQLLNRLYLCQRLDGTHQNRHPV